MNKELAEKTSIIALQFGAKIDKHLAVIKDECDENEFKKYQQSVGKIMSLFLMDFMNPIYEEHPSLKPKQMGGTYEVSSEIYE